MEVTATLRAWSDFFLLLGTAAGAFVALLFVAISVGVGFFTERNVGGTRTFTSPVVMHFTVILFLCALALAPTHMPWLFVGVLGLTGLIGSGVALYITVNIIRFEDRTGLTFFDHFAYGAIPLFAYTVIAFDAVLFAKRWPWAPELLAAALLLLMLINIRNTWDLMLTVVRRQSRRR